MEQPQKKRGFWGSISFFGRSTQSLAESVESNGTTPHRHSQTTAAQEPESPAKRASDSQLQSRKILGRPQGPSSRLAQTLNASDFTRLTDGHPNPTGTFAVPDDDSNSSSPLMGGKKLGDASGKLSEPRMPGDIPGKAYGRKPDLPWKSKSMYERTGNPVPGSSPYKAAPRMPGDNPYKTLGASTHRPMATAFPPRASVYGSSTLPSNVFRESMKRPGIPSFSPKIPANTLKQSFPPNTPGKPPRGSTAEVNGRAMRQDDNVELFDLRIPNPPEDLSGEALSKQVPEDKSRVGSIYADEFLAHYCPDDFDDLQRRQFFCILDLRRLKYAADEIFTKKDWKLNVLNFAKEYEKSRSLIMLRYGLYEFKTIRASEAVTKEWKQKHGIADPEEERQALTVSKPNNVGAKRKAEDDLLAKDTALTASSTSANKRVRPENGTHTKVLDSNKNKRKASVSEPDENQPNKMHKAVSPAKPPSLTRSIFESVANSPSTAPKPAPKKPGLIGSAAKMPNGTTRSVFDSPAKAAITHNIFGQLSDTSKGSGNEADSDSDEEEEAEPESEHQEASQSDEPSVVASGGIATPQFPGLLPKVNGASSASSDAGDSTKSRSLFDRVTRNNDGEPVRSQPEPTALETKSASPAKDGSTTPAPAPAPASTPANNTWNTGTPIKFAPSAAAAPSTTPASSLFAPSIQSTTPFTFGAPAPKKDDDASAADSKTPKPATSQPAGSLFGGAASKPESGASIFGASKPTSSAPIQFGSGSAFGHPKTAEKPAESEKKDSATAASTASLFAAKTSTPGSAAPLFGSTTPTPLIGASSSNADASKPSVFQSSTLFGNAPKPEASKPSDPSPLFKAPTEQPAKAPAPSNSLFGNTPSKRAADSIESKTPASNMFGTPAKPAETPAGNIFGNSVSKPANNIFGASTTPAAKENSNEPAAKKPFGQGASALFGGSSTPAPSMLFGASPGNAPAISFGSPNKIQDQSDAVMASPDAGKKGAAGAIGGASAPFSFTSTQPTASFGGSQTPSSTPLFGAASQPTASQSFTAPESTFSFTAGNGAVNNPFASGGTSSAPQSFNFGGSTNANSSAPSSFTFGSTQPASFSFGGDSKPADGGSSTPAFLFGGNAGGSTPSAPANAPASSGGGGNMFAFGGAQNSTTGSIFGQHLAPGGGTSTGTNSPFTFGGASSLATTPATGTPEPGTENEDTQKKPTDGDDEPQAQISLTEGGPGEEDEAVVHEVRAKALKLVVKGDKDEDDEDDKSDNKNPWKVQGVGPLRLLKHKTTGAVRILLRAEPRGHLAMNKALLSDFTYKPEPNGGKYVKITTSNNDGTGLETWMIQVKTPALAKALADALEANKGANKK